MAKKVLKEDKVWLPDLRWLLKVLIIVYVISIVGFFVANYFLKPYMRDIPKEITPWLNNSDKNISDQK